MPNTAAFDSFAAQLDGSMILVTARAGQRLAGCLVGFSTQCSIDPVRYLVCLSRRNQTCEVALEADELVIHWLHDDEHDRDLARLFGEETGRDTDKFTACDWRPDTTGAVLTGCDWFGGPIVGRTDGGDHIAFVLAVVDGEARRADEPSLGFQAVRDLEAGNPA